MLRSYILPMRSSSGLAPLIRPSVLKQLESIARLIAIEFWVARLRVNKLIDVEIVKSPLLDNPNVQKNKESVAVNLIMLHNRIPKRSIHPKRVVDSQSRSAHGFCKRLQSFTGRRCSSPIESSIPLDLATRPSIGCFRPLSKIVPFLSLFNRTLV